MILLLAIACAPFVDEPARVGTTTVAARDGIAWVALTDHGEVARVDVAAEVVSRFPVGVEPIRVALAGDEVAVTLRGERSIVLLDADGAELDRAEIGAEPVGVVATADGRRIYVALSQEDAVIELDGALRERRRWPVADEPRWLALDEARDGLFVGSVYRGRLSRISLDDDVVAQVALPEISGRPPEGDEVTLVPRITGDLAISPDGAQLALPVLYADLTTPIANTRPGEIGAYASPPGDGVGRMNNVVVRYALGDSGLPGAPRAERLLVQIEDEGVRRAAATSYGSAVVYAPDRADLVLVVEGMDVVAPMLDGEAGFTGAIPTVPRPGTEVGGGPRGGAWVDGRLVLDAWLDAALTVFPTAASAWTPGVEVGRIPLAEPALPEDVLAGRRMFFSARDRRTSVVVGGVSCATCHFQGRNDGFTWPHRTGDVQTPSLAGKVSETTPLPWSGQVGTVGEEGNLTATLRMGGLGMSEEERAHIAAYIDTTPLPDRAPPADTDAVARGEALFKRADVGCVVCHLGDRGTDNDVHAVAGFENATNTPPLTGVAATAPYLHDGSAPTLRDLLERVRDGSMGDTSGLSDAELDDLEAYVRSR